MLGKLKIFFGKVVDVNDPEKLNRLRISINGLTDRLAVDMLPWYFPFYGINYLPVENDEVSVLQLDGNFATCFYGRKINLPEGTLSDGDYANYLEIFKRQINDKNVQLTYTESTGIEFINGDGKIQTEIDKISLFVGINSIVMTENRIDIGNEKQEPTILGDKGVACLQNIILHQMNTINQMITMFTAISTISAALPITAHIASALSALIPTATTTLTSENQQVNLETRTIQSRKVFIE